MRKLNKTIQENIELAYILAVFAGLFQSQDTYEKKDEVLEKMIKYLKGEDDGKSIKR